MQREKGAVGNHTLKEWNDLKKVMVMFVHIANET